MVHSKTETKIERVVNLNACFEEFNARDFKFFMLLLQKAKR